MIRLLVLLHISKALLTILPPQLYHLLLVALSRVGFDAELSINFGTARSQSLRVQRRTTLRKQIIVNIFCWRLRCLLNTVLVRLVLLCFGLVHRLSVAVFAVFDQFELLAMGVQALG